MAFQPVVNVAEVHIRETMQGIPVENTYYVRNSAGWDESTLEELVGLFADWFPGSYHLIQGAHVIGTEIYARDLTTEIAAQATDLAIAGSAGAAAGTPLPGNIALAVKRLSGMVGRSARGRIFWCGWTASHVDTDENFITVGNVNNLLAYLATLESDIAAAGYESVIVSRYNAGVKRSAGLVLPVSGWAVTDRRVDTMRRRLVE